ncbi:MAG: hypothetical protein R6V56_06460 [Lentisphaeria bacterium]
MKILNNLYDQATEWCNLTAWFGVEPAFQSGFLAGIALLLAAILLCVIIRMRFSRRKRCKGITIAGDSGDMFITLSAIREFVKRILGEFDETSLEGIKLRQRRNTLTLIMDVAVLPDVELVPLRNAMQGRIVEEAQNQLGIDQPFQVHVTVKSVEASEKKVGAKRTSHKNQPKDAEEIGAFDEM